LTEEELERYAIRAARGDDVPKWPAKFTKEQKTYWRNFVTDLAKMIGDAEFLRGYTACQKAHETAEQARQSRSLRRMLGKK
jgi:hypothetical protein